MQSTKSCQARGTSVQICQVVHTQGGGDLSQAGTLGRKEAAEQAAKIALHVRLVFILVCCCYLILRTS